MDKIINKIKADIEMYGVSVLGIGGDANAKIPSFSYTVGQTAKGLPELIVFGLPLETAHAFLNDITIGKAVENQSLFDGMVLENVANLPLCIRSVEEGKASEFVRFAFHLYGSVKVMQVVWSDREGRFPWHPDFDLTMISAQIPLWSSLH